MLGNLEEHTARLFAYQMQDNSSIMAEKNSFKSMLIGIGTSTAEEKEQGQVLKEHNWVQYIKYLIPTFNI